MNQGVSLEVRAPALPTGTLQGEEFENTPDDAGGNGQYAKEDGFVQHDVGALKAIGLLPCKLPG